MPTALRSPFRVILCLLVLMSALTALYFSRHMPARAEAIPASTTQANWEQSYYNAAHTNFNPHESILSPSTVPQLTLAWTFHPTGGGWVSSPIVAHGVVYFSQGNYLFGRDAVTGARVTVKKAPGTLALSNGRLYSGYHCMNNSCVLPGVIAINPTTTHTVWQFTGSSETTPAVVPVVAGNIVYLNGGSTLYALNAATGAVEWSFTNSQVGTPAVANGIVYLPTGNGLYALNAVTGAVQWTTPIGCFDSPAIVSGTVYCSGGYDIAALDAVTGTLKWSNTKINDESSPLAIAGGVIYFGTQSGTIEAILARNGKVQWTSTIISAISASINSLSIANGVLYTSAKNNLFAIDAATGTTLWHYTTGLRGWFSSPATANGMVYITDLGRPWNLYAFHLPS